MVSMQMYGLINGTDVADSASRFGLPARKSSGDPSELIGAMNIFLTLDADDYIEVAGGVSDVGVELWYSASQTTPFPRPAIPSVILTINSVSGGSLVVYMFLHNKTDKQQ